MTPQEAITLLRQRLGARTPSNQLGEHLLRELNAVQLDAEGGPLYPFFLESYAGGIVPSTTFNGFSLPDDFITEHEERPLSWTSAGGVVTDLEKRPFDELIHLHNTEGDPSYYAIVGGTDVYTFPYPTTGTYSLHYYAHIDPVTVDSLGTTNKWDRFAPLLLIARAGFNYAANTFKDPELTSVFQKQVTDAEAKLIALNTQQSMAKFEAGNMRLRG